MNGKYVLGDNSSNIKNALESGNTCPETIFVPKYVYGHKIEEIGAYPFDSCTNTKVLNVKARITQINYNAFRQATSLEKVYLPNTLKYIFDNAIHVWNSTLGNGVINPGITEIFFF